MILLKSVSDLIRISKHFRVLPYTLNHVFLCDMDGFYVPRLKTNLVVMGRITLIRPSPY